MTNDLRRESMAEERSKKVNTRLRRAGFGVAVALACVLVTAVLAGAMLRTLLAERRQAMRIEHRIQAMWLAESAIERARARLAASPGYAGETWQVRAEAFGDRWSGAAVIRVERVPGDAAGRRIVVEARYPETLERRAVHLCQLVVRVPVSGDGS